MPQEKYRHTIPSHVYVAELASQKKDIHVHVDLRQAQAVITKRFHDKIKGMKRGFKDLLAPQIAGDYIEGFSGVTLRAGAIFEQRELLKEGDGQNELIDQMLLLVTETANPSAHLINGYIDGLASFHTLIAHTVGDWITMPNMEQLHSVIDFLRNVPNNPPLEIKPA